MASNHAELDTETLTHDLHGTDVNQSDPFICDYCNANIPINEPVLYEAIRIGEMPNLKAILNTPPGWGLDAARCQACDIDTIEPATDGFDEALVMLTIKESNGIRSADSSQLTVVDYSPNGDGYYPPPVDPQLIAKMNDFGPARWIRLRYVLEQPGFTEKVSQEYLEALKQSREIPPDVNL